MKKLLARAAGILTALFLLVALPMTSMAAGGTLADYAVGTVFKIKEDGIYNNWVLINHNYLATGNQLLMRENTLYYGTQLPLIYYEKQSSKSQYWYEGTTFYNSELSTYLNNDFYYDFLDSTFRSYIKQVAIQVLKEPSETFQNAAVIDVNYKLFILSHREMTGATDAVNILSTGSFISYFSSAARIKSNTEYTLRDGYNDDRGTLSVNYSASYVTTDGVVSSILNSAAPKYFRPCLVLSANFPVNDNNQLDGIITPSTPTVTLSSEWATSNTATITATSATSYAVTATNTAPSSGWQTSNVFTLTDNGTYYAWARSSTNTISESKSFTVSKIDGTKPTVNSVAVPTTWGVSGTITISASDAGSGISAYAVTTGGTSAPVAGWQTSNSFIFLG